MELIITGVIVAILSFTLGRMTVKTDDPNSFEPGKPWEPDPIDNDVNNLSWDEFYQKYKPTIQTTDPARGFNPPRFMTIHLDSLAQVVIQDDHPWYKDPEFVKFMESE